MARRLRARAPMALSARSLDGRRSQRRTRRTNPEALRRAIDQRPRKPGTAILRDLLDSHTFALTDSSLERWVLPIARRAGFPLPLTKQHLDGFRVDFYWPDLGLVVETDGLRYHRTAAEQTADRRRDQAHDAAGRVPLRFSRAQVVFEPEHVEATLKRVVRRLAD